MCNNRVGEVIEQDRKEAVKIASDMVKILLNFAVGGLALLIVFFRNDTFKSLSTSNQHVVVYAGIFLLLSIFFGVFAINRIYKRIEGHLLNDCVEFRWSTAGIVAVFINAQAISGIFGILSLSYCLVFIGTPKP